MMVFARKVNRQTRQMDSKKGDKKLVDRANRTPTSVVKMEVGAEEPAEPKFQIAKSVYSGFTASVGADNMPAATVALVPCSIKMNEPVNRFVV